MYKGTLLLWYYADDGIVFAFAKCLDFYNVTSHLIPKRLVFLIAILNKADICGVL